MRKVSPARLLGLVALVAVACSSSEKDEGTKVVTKELARQEIGPGGGTLSGGALTIEVPPGAVATPKAFVIQEIVSGGGALPSATKLAGKLYALEPDDIDFAVPVTVTVNLDGVEKTSAAARVLFRAAANTAQWTPYGADQADATRLVGKTTHFSQWAPTSAAETRCFRGLCGPIMPPGPPDPNKLPGLNCTVPAQGPGVHCEGKGGDPGERYVCSCVGSTTILGSYTRLPPDTFITAMAVQCGASCAPEPALACDLGLTCDGADGAQWNCGTTREPAVLCNHTPSGGTTCSCKNGGAFSLPTTKKPTNDELVTAWQANCGGMCNGAQNPDDQFVCPGTVAKDGKGGGCLIETAGTCRDNHVYAYECEKGAAETSKCTCLRDGMPTGKVVEQGRCVGYEVWGLCGFPKQQGQP